MQPISSPISSAVLSNRFLTSNSCHGLDFPCKQFIDSIMNVLSVVHGLININIIPKKMSLRKADTATPGMPMLQSEKKQFVEIVLLTTVDGCFLEAGSIKEVVETVGHVDKEYIVQNVITCNKKMTAYLPHLAEIDTFNEFGSSIWLPAHDMNTSKGKDQLSSRNNSSVPQSSVIPCSQLPAIGVDSSNSISRGTLGGSLPQPSSDGLHPQFTPSFNWDHGFGFAASTNSGSIGSLAPSNNNKITILASKRYRTEAKSSISMVKCIACSTNGLFLETTSGKSTSQHTSLETTEGRSSKKRKTDERQMQVLDANFLSVRTPISVANVSQAPFYSYIPSTLYMGGPAPAVGGGTSSTFTSEGFFPTSTSHAAVNASSTFQSLPMSMSMPPSVVVPSLASSMNDVNAASTVLESSSQLYVISNKFDRPSVTLTAMTPAVVPYSQLLLSQQQQDDVDINSNRRRVNPSWDVSVTTEATDFIHASDAISGLLSLSTSSATNPSTKSNDKLEVYHSVSIAMPILSQSAIRMV